MDYAILYEQELPVFYGFHTRHHIFKAENDDDAERKAFEFLGRMSADSHQRPFRAIGIAKVTKKLN